jgi:methionyl-tRNA formyltransferase
MTVVFFGTPEFSLPTLHALINSRHRVAGVVSAPAKPVGRGRTVQQTPVAQEAERIGLPLLQPEKLKDPGFLAALKSWQAEVFVVVAFRILPDEVLNLPKYGAVNLHASLLPAYRGAAPIQWALWNGETETGVTVFRIEKAVDTGNILKQVRVKIQSEDDAGTLAERLAAIGADLMVQTLYELERGAMQPRPQEHHRATAAPKITREHCEIDWRRSAQEIHNQIRALSPEPGAGARFDHQHWKFYKSAIEPATDPPSAGEMLIRDDCILIGTGDGVLRITELQLQGRKRLSAEEFLRGFRFRGKLKSNH